VVGGGVFAVGLVGEDFVVGYGVGAGARDFSEVEALEFGVDFQDALGLVVDVKDVEPGGVGGQLPGPGVEESLHHGFAKGVEEEGQAGAGRKRELDGVGEDDLQGGLGTAGGAPEGNVLAGDAGEGGVEFDADDRAERELGGDEEGAAHACAEVEEGEVLKRRGGLGALPAFEQGEEDGRRDAVIGGGMAVVEVAGLEVTAGDQAAGADAEFQIEGVGRVAVLDGEARQAEPGALFSFLGLAGWVHC